MKELISWEANGMPLQYRETGKKSLTVAIMEFATLLFLFWLVISGFSIIGVMMGQDVPYMPFWHAPWKWLLSFFM